jgi:hypothetical protein
VDREFAGLWDASPQSHSFGPGRSPKPAANTRPAAQRVAFRATDPPTTFPSIESLQQLVAGTRPELTGALGTLRLGSQSRVGEMYTSTNLATAVNVAVV